MKSYWVRRQTIEKRRTHENPAWSYDFQQDKDYYGMVYFTHRCSECDYYYEVEAGEDGYNELLEKYLNGGLE